MLSKYLIFNSKFKKPVIVAYNQFGVLAFYDGSELDKSQSEFFRKHLPTDESIIPQYKKEHPYLKITPAAMDTSFEAAYDAYNLKLGKKEKARAIWDKLPEGEKQAFFKMLPDYKKYLAKTGYGQAYFEVFLRNCYWKNDYTQHTL